MIIDDEKSPWQLLIRTLLSLKEREVQIVCVSGVTLLPVYQRVCVQPPPSSCTRLVSFNSDPKMTASHFQ